MDNTKIKVGETYVFTKSGNRVKAISVEDNGTDWTVERVDGRSAGKQMIVPGSTLVAIDQWPYDSEWK